MNTTSNRRLLIIDDNRAIHDDLRKILCPQIVANGEARHAEDVLFGGADDLTEIEPFLVDSAFQGQEGLQLVQRSREEGRRYALAFIDVRMPPGWDGVQTTKEIWQVDPDVQIVICTAYSDYSWAEMISQLGHSDNLVVLKKPFDNIEALQLVHALTTKWELSRQARERVKELDRLVAQSTEQLRSANDQLTADIVARKETELRLEAFATLGSRLGAAQTVRDAAQIIVEVADQLIGWDCCVCDSYSAAEDQVSSVLNMDILDGQKKHCALERLNDKPTALAHRVIAEGGQLLLRSSIDAPDPDTAPFGDKSRRSASILYVPIRNGATVIGLLSVQSYTFNAYNRHHLETLQALADHCGGALNRIKSEEALRLAEAQFRQAQKMEAVGQLAGGVAHDFNNILVVILGNAELALKEAAERSGTLLGYLTQIIDAANRAANLTRQLLAFGRKQIVQARPLNLNQQIMSLSKMLKRIIGEDIQLRCNYAPTLPLIQADATMIDQVVMNLVVNARDAMVTGGCLDISTDVVNLDRSATSGRPESRPGHFVLLSVADNGAGIAPENLSHIFEPFFTTKEVGKGTGLGLATVFGIVKQHSGWIEVSSKPGTGTAFNIFLPALAQSATSADAAQVKPAAPGGSEVILLVEDDDGVRRVSRRMLEGAGYQLLEASCGRDALEVWDRHRGTIDLLLTDLVMPGGMNGRALAEKLIGAKPDLKVLFMSGYSGDILNGNPAHLRPSQSRLLVKPCTREELLEAVRQQLDGKGSLSQAATTTNGDEKN